MQTAHMHVDEIRPDRITSTSVVAPYSVNWGPGNVAQMTARRFIRSVRAIGPALAGVPVSAVGAQPEEIAMRAQRIATALAEGMRVPPGTDPRVLRAAQLILKGEPFVIKSAGRAVRVV
jgi:hypothetical protein